MSFPLRLLLVEDSEDDALLLLRELRRGWIQHNPSTRRYRRRADGPLCNCRNGTW
jgi:hypothetical protein